MDSFFWDKAKTTIQYAWPVIIICIIFAYVNYRICKSRIYPPHKVTGWMIAGFLCPLLSTIILIVTAVWHSRIYNLDWYLDKSKK